MIRSTLEFWFSGHYLPKYRNTTGIPVKNTGIPVKTPVLGLIKKRLTVLGFNDTSTLVGHFMSSPREREKSDRRDSRRD